MTRAIVLGGALVMLSLAPSPARAQAPQAEPPPSPTRVVGFGTTLGISIEGTSRSPSTPYVTAIGPAFEMRVPVHRRVELALWVPVINLLLIPAVSNRRMVWGDLFATIYPTASATGFFVAPGLGFAYGWGDSSGYALRAPVRVGWEVSTAGRGFGFNIALRPWVDLVVPLANIEASVRYGAVLELGVIGYATR